MQLPLMHGKHKITHSISVSLPVRSSSCERIGSDCWAARSNKVADVCRLPPRYQAEASICVRLPGLWCTKGHSQVLLEALSIFRKAARAVVRSTGATDPGAPLLVYRHPRRVVLALLTPMLVHNVLFFKVALLELRSHHSALVLRAPHYPNQCRLILVFLVHASLWTEGTGQGW